MFNMYSKPYQDNERLMHICMYMIPHLYFNTKNHNGNINNIGLLVENEVHMQPL